MELEIYKEANKIWTSYASESKDTALQFSIEIHEKLLDFFHVGDYYYFIFNIKHSAFDLISKEVTNVLGYTDEEVNVPFLLSNIHPEDQTWFLNFENQVTQFFSTLSPEQRSNYKFRYDYRIRKRNGVYVRILQQVVPIQFDEDKRILRTFGVHTDISSFKKEGTPQLSFIGLNGQPSYFDVNVQKVFPANATNLTGREQEILALIIKGKKSEEIAKSLFISKQTVDTHRKNLLKKTNCKNAASLISTAVRMGWV